MRKIIALMCCLAAMAQSLVAGDSRNLYVKTADGELKVYTYTAPGQITFANPPISIGDPQITESTETSFSAKVSMKFTVDQLKSTFSTAEVGVCFSSENTNPEVDNDAAVLLGTEIKDYTFTLQNLDSGTQYFYRPFVKLFGYVLYGETENITTQGTKPDYVIIDNRQFVDLGLQSGTKWARYNIGASAADLVGDYLAWGETAAKDEYTTSNYTVKKYNDSDGLYTLDENDDAAKALWGENCSMPTEEQCKELIEHCTWAKTTQTTASGETVTGFLGTSNYNKRTIFLPAAGGKIGTKTTKDGEYGYYWCNTRYADKSGFAYIMELTDSNKRTNYIGRDYGLQVRAVSTSSGD